MHLFGLFACVQSLLLLHMDTSKGLCPHQSIPIEVDESMTASSLDLDWPPNCQQCSGPGNSRSWEETGEMNIHVNRERLLRRYFQSAPKTTTPPTADLASIPAMHGGSVGLPRQEQNHTCGIMGPEKWPGCSVNVADGLEPPLPLMSDAYAAQHVPSRYPAPYIPCQWLGPKPAGCLRHCVCPPYHGARPFERTWNHPGNKMQYEDVPNATDAPQLQAGVAPRDVMCEVSLDCPIQADPGPGTRETRKTVTLPDDYRNVFITYSVDTAEEMTAFTRFLTSQGFKPAIDIFDNPTIRMGITRWMDRFLNDKSVLIIVAISPKYKEDVEGDSDDEHGLHTKYIHNQIQNEFIQQGCLNFRLIPVLFANATKKHVPSWLQNTRIYRWPQDMQDLLLRLLRVERYIIPQAEASLTLTIRPL
ncbi:E3 ubiquitin ligase TRAF3IP2 isoform X1 [Phycodurus eques]|uniref:E3 ubiquitin ligase TRAF3IP2 isoform X1 n=3 Tax=Phycodurus eques TaxID=693459 RepID=UPI002ACD664B|nr:E3 ubiquitin ligase TRAF3IP2 isoform X1 [Phycodurus eques]